MAIETTELAAGYTTPRVLRGGWQLAGGHGPVDKDQVIEGMIEAARAGFTTLDCADAYTGVEALFGAFRQAYRQRCGAAAAAAIKVHTKYLPNAESLPALTKADVEAGIDRSLRRLHQERLDLVQFHWWRYEVPRHVEVAHWLDELRRAGKIHLLGTTNFDTPHLRDMAEAGVPMASTQIQYSLLDRRAENGMVDLCARHGIKLICFGVIAGGLLSEKHLGAPEPSLASLTDLSKVKYLKVIMDFGGWGLFQTLLEALKQIADKHGASIANVASRYMLEQPQVGAIALGARSGDTHLQDNLRIFSFRLDAADHELLAPVLARRAGPSGDVWEQERDRNSRHGVSGVPYSRDQGAAAPGGNTP